MAVEAVGPLGGLHAATLRSMAMSVPFFSFGRMHTDVDPTGSIQRVVDRASFVLGPEVHAFERDFADYCGVAHAIGVANGTDALELALRGLGVEAGDRVAVVANAGGYSATAVRAIDADPLWVDVDERTLTMAPGALEQALAQTPLAVIVTHLYGRLADLASLLALTDQAGIPLIEDSAQSHGARRDGNAAGASGRVGCFSFYPTKNLGAVGDGGAVVTDDPTIASRVRALRQYGWADKYRAVTSGGRNSRLDEIQAAVLVDKLPHLDEWNRQRREVARRYSDGLAGLPLMLPPWPDDADVVHLFVVRTDRRDALADFLQGRGIQTAVHYPIPDYHQPAYATAGTPDLPVTEAAASSVLSLPCYPGLTATQQELVMEGVRAFFGVATD